ncbi:MAG: tyrosine-type recombinase/integrase [Deltaproteobacteria bacterium]|nr:tyrosine-type recombinase/integrase [Deltaproteobacteria bacterium]
MKPFESFFAEKIEKYLLYRQALGFALHPTTDRLRAFDRYLAMRKPNPTLLPSSFFLELRADLKLESRSVNHVLSATRLFFRYLVRKGVYVTNPVEDIPRLPKNEIIPFLFSDEQVDLLLRTILTDIRNRQRYFFKDLTGYMIILIIARCGLRISEPLKMKIHHYRRKEKTLYIEKTKFKKDRLIPVPSSTAVELENYLAVRKATLENPNNPFLFVGKNQKGISDNRIRYVFKKAVNDIGLDQPRQVIGSTNFSAPTVHSLRHAFAVNTLKAVQARGRSPQNALPVLATYMGHVEYKYTVKYLKMIDAEKRKQFFDFSVKQREKR